MYLHIIGQYEHQKLDVSILCLSCLTLSEKQPSKIIHIRAITSSQQRGFRDRCLFMIQVIMLSTKLHLVPPDWEESKPADTEARLSCCWIACAFRVFWGLQCMRCVSQGHMSPRAFPTLSNVSINCRAVTNSVHLTGNTLDLMWNPRLLIDVIKSVKLFHTTAPLSLCLTGF